MTEDATEAEIKKLADLYSLDTRLDRLQDSVNRLEKIVEVLLELYQSERVKSWEMILQGMLKEQERKKGNYGKRIST